MGLFGKKQERNHFPEMHWSYASPDYFAAELNPTVSACVDKIANTLSVLPLQLYAHTKNGKKLAVSNPIFRLLEHPSAEETPALFYSDLYRQILNSGNGYVLLGRYNGEVRNLTVCDSKKVQVERNSLGKKVFKIGDSWFTERDILHIPYLGAGYNGTKGVAPADTFRDLVNLDNALLLYIHTYFDNSLGSRSVLELDSSLNDKIKDLDRAYASLLPYINKFVTGAKNGGKMMIPPPGTKLSKIEQPSNAEAELHSLLNQVERQIATAYQVPYEIINSEASKYNSLEQKQNDFLSACIQPFGNHICQSFEKLLDPKDTALFIQFEYKNLLATDTKTTIDYLRLEVESGLLTVNEARKKLGMEDIGSAGDVHFIPANLMPLTDEIIESYMAKQKIALEEHNKIGDDK